MSNSYARFQKDKWFGKTLPHPDWVKEAIENSSDILTYYESATPLKEVVVGNGSNWKIILNPSPIAKFLPKVLQWLDDNNTVVWYWTISQPTDKSTEHIEELEFLEPDIRYSFNIHSDIGMQAEELELWDKSIESDKDPFAKISLNLPLDTNDGFESIKVYSYGTPSARQRSFNDYIEIGVEHGFFHMNDVKLEYEETNAKNLPVLLNVCQPHAFHISTNSLRRRIILRLKTKGTKREDPWHLLEN